MASTAAVGACRLGLLSCGESERAARFVDVESVPSLRDISGLSKLETVTSIDLFRCRRSAADLEPACDDAGHREILVERFPA